MRKLKLFAHSSLISHSGQFWTLVVLASMAVPTRTHNAWPWVLPTLDEYPPGARHHWRLSHIFSNLFSQWHWERNTIIPRLKKDTKVLTNSKKHLGFEPLSNFKFLNSVNTQVLPQLWQQQTTQFSTHHKHCLPSYLLIHFLPSGEAERAHV